MLFVKIQVLRENGVVLTQSLGPADCPLEWSSSLTTALIIESHERLVGWEYVPRVITQQRQSPTS